MLTINKQVSTKTIQTSTNRLRRATEKSTNSDKDSNQQQQNNSKRLHFKTQHHQRSNGANGSSQQKTPTTMVGRGGEVLTAEHMKNVEVFKRAWRELDESRQKCSSSVFFVEEVDEADSRFSDFKAIDLEDFWGRRQLEKIQKDLGISDELAEISFTAHTTTNSNRT